jgi:hypothetical protein
VSRELELSEIAEKLAVEFCCDVSITTVIRIVGECGRDETLTSLPAVEQAARVRLAHAARTYANEA